MNDNHHQLNVWLGNLKWSNPCTWHLIQTSLAPSIAGNTMVILTGASHCHIVWNSNNSVIATTTTRYRYATLLSTFFNQFNLKTTLRAIIDFFKGIFVPKGSFLTWHYYCFVSLSTTGTGHGETIKQFIFPAQLMFCWWLWSPLPLTAEVRGPR